MLSTADCQQTGLIAEANVLLSVPVDKLAPQSISRADSVPQNPDCLTQVQDNEQSQAEP